jgi:hypothetical protein
MNTDTAHDAVAARPLGERELKFTLPTARAGVARRLLEQLCSRDPQFPAAVVWTIYYDTPGLSSLGEKVNSDYLKRKIRVRWYSDLDGRPSGPAFVEAKIRTGNRRSKVREKVPYRADELAQWKLSDPRLLRLPLLLQRDGVLGQESWQPLITIRYRRDRFVERLSGSRISLDAEIAAVDVRFRLASGPAFPPLNVAVLEVKGTGEDLPRALRAVAALGLRKQSFSKFLAVYAHATRMAM